MEGRHYLDHASTTPLRPEVREALAAWLSGECPAADPGRAFAEGRVVRDAIELAREQVAALVGSRPSEVVFTSGGTEAANWVNAALLAAGPGRAPGRAVLAGVEHSAVRRSAARHGRTVAVAVDRSGRLDLAALDEALAGEGEAGEGEAGAAPSLAHCQWANHEVGTLQPVQEAVARCRDRGIPVHVDACAAVGAVPVDFSALGADLLSLSGHKLGAPAGVGALVVRRGRRLAPLLLGGEQERARRAGMENVLGIVGLGAAAAALGADGVLAGEAARKRALSEQALAAALAVDGVVAYGDTEQRVPHIVCVGVPDIESEAVVLGLDRAGVAAHSGSACASEGFEPSPVLQAMGVDAERSLRISVGWSSTPEDVTAFAGAFAEVVSRLRALR